MKKLFAFGALALAACQLAPYTQRQQFILISPAEEQSLGVQAYKETLSKSKVVAAGPDAERIRRVGGRIAPVADADLQRRGMQPFAWEFKLIDEKTVNAWCLPGGKVAFYKGILPVCESDAGVAVVMGHEIGHAIARHGAERMTTAFGVELVGELLSTGFSKSKPDKKEAYLGAYGLLAGLGSLKYSRVQESEADHIGLMLMAKAGYDPREAVAFWKRMAAQSKGSPPEFLSTHPSDETRIRQIEKLLPEALAVRKASQ